MKSVFYKIYFSVIAVFFVALISGLFWLYSWLNEFETQQPNYIINNAIEKYLEGDDITQFSKDYNINISPYEDIKKLNNIFNERKNGKTLKISEFSKTENNDISSYIISAQSNPLVKVNLKKQKENTAFGARYKLYSLELDESFFNKVKIVMPSSADITINGKKLQNDIRKEMECYDTVKPLAEVTGSDVLQEAEITHLLSQNINIEAMSDNKKLNVIKNGNIYYVEQNLPNNEVNTIKNFATEATKEYAAYMQDDSSFEKVSKYLKKDSEFYINVKTSLTVFAWDHDSFEFENVKVQNIHKYNDNLYRCKVSFAQMLKLGAREYKDTFDKYVYLTRENGEFKVIDMVEAGTN